MLIKAFFTDMTSHSHTPSASLQNQIKLFQSSPVQKGGLTSFKTRPHREASSEAGLQEAGTLHVLPHKLTPSSSAGHQYLSGARWSSVLT